MSKNIEAEEYTEGSLPIRFDIWLRKTMYHIISTEIRDISRRKRRERELKELFQNSLEISGNTVDPYEDLWTEKIDLGNFEMRITNEKVAEAILSLSKREKLFIECFFLLDMKTADIARETGLSPHTISNYKSAIFNKLKKVILEEEDDE